MRLHTLAIRQIEPDAPEVTVIHRIRAACAADLAARFGPGHWAVPTTLSRVNDEAGFKALYAIAAGTTIVATLALTQKAPGFFNLKHFARPRDPAAYLSSLAVTPSCQGLGIGTWCMQQADAVAVNWQCRALRFDAYDSPAGAARFYEKNGYRPRAHIVFHKVPLIIFEKVFNGAS